MRYPRLLAALRSARWAIAPSALQSIYDSLGAHLRGDLRFRADMEDAPTNPLQPSPLVVSSIPLLAVIPVHGILGKHLSSLETECGGCDVDAIRSAVDAALADPAVRALVLDFDSPGGTVTGIPELAAHLREAVTHKPIFAFTSSQCCSAAYWLAASCSALFATLSADVGSIGVYMALVDDSEWWKKEGYKLELIKAGKFKALGISGQPLSDDERALLQADVDRIYAMFTADVRAGRGTVEDSTMQGQTFMGEMAVGVNLVDEIVPDLDTLLANLSAASIPAA